MPSLNSNFHRCSMGFRSGLLTDHFRTLLCFVSIHFCYLNYVCGHRPAGRCITYSRMQTKLSDTVPYTATQNPLVIFKCHDALHTIKAPNARGSKTTQFCFLFHPCPGRLATVPLVVNFLIMLHTMYKGTSRSLELDM